MKTAVCPQHPGIRTDHKPCYRCSKEEPMDESTITLTTAGGKSATMPTERFGPALREATAAVIAEHRRAEQPTLSETLFPPIRRADVPTVKIAISGTIELTQAEYQSYLDGALLGPGAVVEIRAAGYVVQPGAAWVKRKEGSGDRQQTWHEREGRVKIKLTDLGELSATGEEWSE